MWDHCKGLLPAPHLASMAKGGLDLPPVENKEVDMLKADGTDLMHFLSGHHLAH